MSAANGNGTDNGERNTWVAVLGRRDMPTDGIEDYCSFLGRALECKGVVLRSTRVLWAEKGWLAALRSLWTESADWRGNWVLLQYTTMMWSRRGFPFGACAVLLILRRRGLRCAVVFHEPFRQDGNRWVDRLRGRMQDWVIRRLYSRANKAVFLDPLEKIDWLPSGASKAVFIPIGANIPEDQPREIRNHELNGAPKTVAVFCISGSPHRQREVGDIAHAMRYVAQRGIKARVVLVGSGTAEAREEIDHSFGPATGVKVVNLGLRSAEEVQRVLSEADAMLCVRGAVYMRRGSAIAGIACGLPIVGYAGAAEGTPLEEAGLELVPYGDRDALGKALARVLTEPERQRLLSSRSWQAQQKHFAWERIADSFVGALKHGHHSLKLLIYSHDWAPSLGGVQTVTMVLARGVAVARANSVCVTLVTHTPASAMDDAALPFRVVRRPRLVEFLRLAKAADLLHLAGPALFPLAVAWLLRKPTVVEHHGYQTICPNGLLIFGRKRAVCPGYFMARRYDKCVRCGSIEIGWARSIRNTALTFPRRWLTKRATANVVPSRHIGERSGLPRTKLIYHGVPSKAQAPTLENANYEHPVCFAFAGRLVPEKGADLLLRAARKLSKTKYDFRVRIVGDGPERTRLEQMSVALGLTGCVEFLGAVTADHVDATLSSAEAVVMPSTWEDVAPLVVLEQMMQGRLLIASDIGGLGETLGRFGLKFPAGDVDALVSCMRYVITNRQAINELRERAWQHALEMYTETRMVEQHADLYHRIAG